MPTTKEELENISFQLEGVDEYVVLAISNVGKTGDHMPVNSIIKTSEMGNTVAVYMLLMNSAKFDSAKKAVNMWGLKTGHFIMTRVDIDNLVETGVYPTQYSGDEFNPGLDDGEELADGVTP